MSLLNDNYIDQIDDCVDAQFHQLNVLWSQEEEARGLSPRTGELLKIMEIMGPFKYPHGHIDYDTIDPRYDDVVFVKDRGLILNELNELLPIEGFEEVINIENSPYPTVKYKAKAEHLHIKDFFVNVFEKDHGTNVDILCVCLTVQSNFHIKSCLDTNKSSYIGETRFSVYKVSDYVIRFSYEHFRRTSDR